MNNKQRRRLFKQRAVDIRNRINKYHHHIYNNDDFIKSAIEYYSHGVENSGDYVPKCVVRVYTPLRNRLWTNVKSHWFHLDTVRCAYNTDHAREYQTKSGKTKSILMFYKHLLGKRLMKFTRRKRFTVQNNLKLYRLKCKCLNHVYIRPTIDNAICNMLSSAVA